MKHPIEITEVLSLWNAIRWQWNGKLVLFLGRTKLPGAQEKGRGGGFCLFRAFHLSAYISCITINLKSNHLNHTLKRSAPTCTSRHVPAQWTPAFFFSPLLPFGVISRKIFCLLTLQLLLDHSTRSHGERATSTSLIRMQSFNAVLNFVTLVNQNGINVSTSLASNPLILPMELSTEQFTEIV